MKLFIFNEKRPVVLFTELRIRLEPNGLKGDHLEISPEQSRHPHVVEFLRLGRVSVLTEKEAKVRLKPVPAPTPAPAPKKVPAPKAPAPVEPPVEEEVPVVEEAPSPESDESFTLDDEKKEQPEKRTYKKRGKSKKR